MLAILIFIRLPLMVNALILDIIRYHLFIAQGIGESPIFLSPTYELRKRVSILFDPLTSR